MKFISRGIHALSSIQGDPRNIAKGFALGIFVGMTPTMGIQMAIAAFLAALLKWNPISAMMGVWITTPATAPAIYGVTYLVGAKIYTSLTDQRLPMSFRVRELPEMLAKTPKIFTALTIGGVLLGLPLAIVSYYAALFFIKEYRKDKEKLKKTLRGWLPFRRKDDSKSEGEQPKET
ncbi:hypothetical protein U27_00177 [Candidatus Vecturithrix granuli]|uniref:DUF2062 domain-containing protein n=1 Tax=Vecturithrix granuli TaxID=1499967 RepID=A0A081C6T1_VECG1|nr:hypothetical protein U27_00177 [Candidatus Vecturithrix granuli]